MKYTIEDITNSILEVLGETKLKSLDHVYEKHGDQLKLIISLHNLNLMHNILMHTKLIFNVDQDKIYLTHNQFTYLFDLNCEYRLNMFKDLEQFKYLLNQVFFDFKFGQDIKEYSKFLLSPSRMVNEYLNSINYNNYSVLYVDYQPKFNITECSNFVANFEISLIDDYKIDLGIKKINNTLYSFTFKINGKYIEKEVKTLENSIPAEIGEFIKNNLK